MFFLCLGVNFKRMLLYLLLCKFNVLCVVVSVNSISQPLYLMFYLLSGLHMLHCCSTVSVNLNQIGWMVGTVNLLEIGFLAPQVVDQGTLDKLIDIATLTYFFSLLFYQRDFVKNVLLEQLQCSVSWFPSNKLHCRSYRSVLAEV